MGQVMRYHQYPTNYDWASMPSDYATPTTASFILDIHKAIHNVDSDKPRYECGGTFVTGSEMDNILKTQFNYSSASYGSYDRNVVVSNIASNRPVLLRGDNGPLGHMWVCDGYRRTTYYFDDCYGVGYLHFYMNWGSYDGQYNGWYSFDDFTPGDLNFNNNKKMIYNITP